MKKLSIISSWILMGGLCMLSTACDDDRDDNPVIQQPTKFVLNTPAYANSIIDLATSKTIHLTCSQANYGYTAAATYKVQVSLDGNFTTSIEEAAADESGETVANYATLEDSYSSCVIDANAAQFAKAIMQIGKWEEGSVPSELDAKVRLLSSVDKYEIASNIVDLHVAPYYIELKDAAPIMWYLVGNMFGGKWGNDPGETALPMFMIPDYGYDKKTGTGEIEYINYFITGPWDDGKNECGSAGFKIQPSTFNWDLGLTGDNNVYDKIIYRDGGSDGGHIVAGADGYYKITVDTSKPSGKMEKYEGTVNDYGTIQIIGEFNGWIDEPMNAYNKEGVENHCWYYVLTSDVNTTIKFKIAGSWDTNWGNTAFPYGIGTNNGDNIPVPAGTWVISFCDITGQYSIIEK